MGAAAPKKSDHRVRLDIRTKHLENMGFLPRPALRNSGNNSKISAAEQRDNSGGNSDKKATISTRTARNTPTP
jgi:hypothetical protein